MTCAPSEDLAQPGHPPSLISLRCLHEETLDPWLLIEHTAKTDQTRRMPRLICVFAVHTCHFVGFVMLRLNCFVPLLPKIKIVISNAPCSSKLPLCPCYPPPPIFRPFFPCSPEINAFVPLFPKTPERTHTYILQ